MPLSQNELFDISVLPNLSFGAQKNYFVDNIHKLKEFVEIQKTKPDFDVSIIKNILWTAASFGFEDAVNVILTNSDNFDADFLYELYVRALLNEKIMIGISILRIAREKGWPVNFPKVLMPEDLDKKMYNWLLDTAKAFPAVSEEEMQILANHIVKYNVREAVDILLKKSDKQTAGFLEEIIIQGYDEDIHNNISDYVIDQTRLSSAAAGRIVNFLINISSQNTELSTTLFLDKMAQQKIAIDLSQVKDSSLYAKVGLTNNTRLLDAIWKHDKQVDYHQPLESTALNEALKMGNFKTAQWLLDHGAAINIKDGERNTPLINLFFSDNPDKDYQNYLKFKDAQNLIQRKAVIATLLNKASIDDVLDRNLNGKSAFLAAAEHGNIEIVVALYNKFGKVLKNQLDETLYNALNQSINFPNDGQLEVVAFLLKQGASLDYIGPEEFPTSAFLNVQNANHNMINICRPYLNKQQSQASASPVFLPFSKPNWIDDINIISDQFNIDTIACAITHWNDQEMHQEYWVWTLAALQAVPPQLDIAQLLIGMNVFPVNLLVGRNPEVDEIVKRNLLKIGINLDTLDDEDFDAPTIEILIKLASQPRGKAFDYLLEHISDAILLKCINLALTPQRKVFAAILAKRGEVTNTVRQLLSETLKPDIEKEVQLQKDLLNAIGQSDTAAVLDLARKGVDLNFVQIALRETTVKKESQPDIGTVLDLAQKGKLHFTPVHSSDVYVNVGYNSVNVAGFTPLQLACRVDDNGQMFKLLITLGANVHHADQICRQQYSESLISHEKLRTPEKVNILRNAMLASKKQAALKEPEPYITSSGIRRTKENIEEKEDEKSKHKPK